MSLDYAILGLLADRPRSGYDLKRRCFDGPVSPFWSADQAQIYRTLDRLKESKAVSATRRRQAGRPDRRIYEMTSRGREILDAWLASSAPAVAPREPFLLRLYFGGTLSDDALLALMESQRSRHQERLDVLRAGVAELAADESLSDRAATLRQTAFEGAITRERAAIDWLDDCIEAVNDGALPGSDSKEIGQRHLFGT